MEQWPAPTANRSQKGFRQCGVKIETLTEIYEIINDLNVNHLLLKIYLFFCFFYRKKHFEIRLYLLLLIIHNRCFNILNTSGVIITKLPRVWTPKDFRLLCSIYRYWRYGLLSSNRNPFNFKLQVRHIVHMYLLLLTDIVFHMNVSLFICLSVI